MKHSRTFALLRCVSSIALGVTATLEVTACGGAPGGREAVPPETATYSGAIRAIMERRCVTCHVPGGVAPFSLADYESVKLYAGAAKVAMLAKRMPPWPAASDCREYVYDGAMPEAEVETFVRWLDDGAPIGDHAIAHAPAPPPPPPPALPRVDFSLTWGEPYLPVPEPGEYDRFRCFVVDWPLAEPAYITGWHARPSNLAVTHHLVTVLIPPEGVADVEAADAADPGPGFACEAGSMAAFGGGGGGLAGISFERLQGRGLIGGWVPGSGPAVLRPGSGFLVRPGSKVLMNMHYNTVAGPAAAPDLTTIDVMTEPSVAEPAISTFFANPLWTLGQMSIPAGDPDVAHAFEMDLTSFLSGGRPIAIHGALLHMHVRGRTAKLSVVRGDEEECLVDVERYDFNWQLGYGFSEPAILRSGDRLRVECHFDNSAANQPYAGGMQLVPQEVNWGEGGSFDEMCLAGINLTLVDE